MRKTLHYLAYFTFSAFSVSLAQAESALEKNLSSVYDNVLIKDAENSEKACQSFADTLKKTQAGASNQAINPTFKDLVASWKRVEANYIGAEIDPEAIDWPRYLDIFHIGNENIHKQMKRAVASDSAPDIALFKNSFKTINALESLLYQDKTLNERELLLANAVTTGICKRLSDIPPMYRKQKTVFMANPTKAVAILTNALVTSSFMLKDWRVGDVAGFTQKYKNHPDPSRSEYALSGNSVAAIRAILDAQSEIIGPQKFANFADIAKGYGADKQVAETQKLLAQAQKEVKEIDRPDFNFDPKQTQAFYKTLSQLHDSFYAGLLPALPVVGKILEADGD